MSAPAQKVGGSLQWGFRLALIVPGMLALLLGMAIGLQRLGWSLPLSALPLSHSWLMVSGFFGTLISLERAVAIQRRWGYLAPACSGVGALLMFFYPFQVPGWLLVNLGCFVLIALYGALYSQHRLFYHALMGLGACCWLAGNLLWWMAEFRLTPLAYTGVLCWCMFLLLTIVAERLELNRLLKPTLGSSLWMAGGLVALLMGLLIHALMGRAGLMLFGSGLLTIAVWLVRFDPARYAMRATGLTAFAGRTLTAGYCWLGIAGVVALVMPELTVGVGADAFLHAFFLGFAFSMVFGHAPIIFPSVLGWRIPFYRRFYSHVILLNGSLLVRLVGDGLGWHAWRQWGGLLNGLALVIFLLNTLSAIVWTRR